MITSRPAVRSDDFNLVKHWIQPASAELAAAVLDEIAEIAGIGDNLYALRDEHKQALRQWRAIAPQAVGLSGWTAEGPATRMGLALRRIAKEYCPSSLFIARGAQRRGLGWEKARTDLGSGGQAVTAAVGFNCWFVFLRGKASLARLECFACQAGSLVTKCACGLPLPSQWGWHSR